MKKLVRRGLHTYGYLLIIATIITVFAALTTIGVSAVEFNTSYYSYDINHNGEISEDEQGVTITGFYGLNGGETVVIPAEIDGKPVLALGLNGATTTMSIPGAEKIGALDLTQATNLKIILPYTFCYCTGLTSLKLPEVTSVGKYAFYYCTGLEDISLSYGCKPPYNAFTKVPDTCQVNGVPLKTYLETYGVNYIEQNAGSVGYVGGFAKVLVAGGDVVEVDEAFSEGLW